MFLGWSLVAGPVYIRCVRLCGIPDHPEHSDGVETRTRVHQTSSNYYVLSRQTCISTRCLAPVQSKDAESPSTPHHVPVDIGYPPHHPQSQDTETPSTSNPIK